MGTGQTAVYKDSLEIRLCTMGELITGLYRHTKERKVCSQVKPETLGVRKLLQTLRSILCPKVMQKWVTPGHKRLMRTSRTTGLESCVWLSVVLGYNREAPRTLLLCIYMRHLLSVLQQPVTGKMSHLGCLTVNYDAIEQPLLLIQGICANLGLDVGTNLHLAINCAAHELMDYVSFCSGHLLFCWVPLFLNEKSKEARI